MKKRHSSQTRSESKNLLRYLIKQKRLLSDNKNLKLLEFATQKKREADLKSASLFSILTS